MTSPSSELPLEAGELEQLYRVLCCALDETGPPFGSPAWLRLDEDDPRRFPGTTLAAWSWWAAENGLGAPASVERLDRLVSDELKAVSLAVCEGEDWPAVSRDLLYVSAAVERRRVALQPRPHDYPGRTAEAAA